ncbi:RagB/SusD family nutrient uptake outer membrane protein [Solitalea canadensis]|uniref:RagB/SusD family protein n=1 Tax=Solitalea canadensis (strain ATCC 29591 / DSM 3403 / JCM 21819 / LMG 8368 / NBRC 15130 / NCIMB 12057 / USAM 9D) TaxID=929556 RepID=H8KR81_SOLCM|nr:RagB/SusD family nutrient uptake outer membrane protein [Solitalea canadensis]AFD07348.1 RagB/SusD family protein [Solitalea canadensis DSM 3403]
MKKYKFFTIALVAAGLSMSSCINDLDTVPTDKRIITSASVFNDPQAYKQMLAKLYGSLTLTGQKGEFGSPELSASDEGTTSFLRGYFNIQEVTTDECINAWGDGGLVEYHGMVWSDANGYVNLMYQRIFINISYCNEYIRSVQERVGGLSEPLKGDVTKYLAEARFMRALYYYYAMDLWGNVPFTTEKDKTGAFIPKQINRKDLFAYIESELVDVLPSLAEARTNEYGRADQAAAWMLLAKMYLNAEVYLGKGNARYTDCLTYCNKIINAGYTLHPKYNELFLADNHKWNEEIILPIAEDGMNTRGYGGVTYIIHAQVGGNMDYVKDYGIPSGPWAGNRFTNTFVNKFADKTGATDKRAMFFTDGQKLDIDVPNQFKEGYLSTKYRNVNADGSAGKHGTFVDTDFPLFRLADVYLMYAEAVKRGGTGGTEATAVSYINKIRERAYGNTSGNIAAANLTLDFILDERARELYWECHRRTDLIRFGKFSGGEYLWDWKGNVKAGAATPAHMDLFPIPASDLSINTNLVQNKGY